MKKLGNCSRNFLAEAHSRWRLSDAAFAILENLPGYGPATSAESLAARVKGCELKLTGPRPLAEAISSAGGVRTDAGPVVKITREKKYGPIPHPSAHETATGASIADINLNSLMEARNPEENIEVKPHDVISVPLAEVVYVVGNVKRAGGFPLGGKPNLSVLQALSLAEGLDARASPKNARILQRSSASGGEATQTPIDLKAILEGKSKDVTLHPNDILFIPSSTAKSVAARTIEAAIQIAAGVAIRY